jgi:hypothetical protein
MELYASPYRVHIEDGCNEINRTLKYYLVWTHVS